MLRFCRHLPLALIVLAGCAAPDAAPEATLPPAVRPLALDARDGSGEPRLSEGADGAVYLSWVEPEAEGHALRLARFRDGAWSAPETVARGAGWMVNWADFPSVAAGPGGALTAHWLVRTPGGHGHDYEVRVSRSDDGRSWSAPRRLHDDALPAEHGFVSLVPLGADSLLAVWLDGRRYARGEEAMTVRARTIRAGGALGPEAEVDSLACDCCGTAAVALPDGGVLAAYRDRTRAEVRDVSVARYEAGRWSAPQTVHEDGWRIDGCPVNGPALDAAGGRVALAWFTSAQDTARVRLALSADDGRSFGPPVRVDLGRPLGRAGVAVSEEGAAHVLWMEHGADGEADVLLRRVGPDGRAEPPLRVARVEAGRASGFPMMARAGSRLLLAWTETGEAGTRVRTAMLEER